MRLNKATGMMSKFLSHIWNPVRGCQYDCTYCWARAMNRRYLRDMKPCYVTDQFKGTLKRTGLTIGVVWNGEMWGDWVPKWWIDPVLDKIQAIPENIFIPLTKNPARYLEFKNRIPKNVILGATIESDIHYPEISKAPEPELRYIAMKKLDFPKFIIIEPIQEFNLEILLVWIKQIRPVAVEIGADSQRNQLSEPAGHKIHALIENITPFTKVLLKENLTRLYDPRQTRLEL